MRRSTCITSKPVSKLPTHLAQTSHLGELPLLVLTPQALCGDVIVTNKLSLIYTEHTWGWGGPALPPSPAYLHTPTMPWSDLGGQVVCGKQPVKYCALCRSWSCCTQHRGWGEGRGGESKVEMRGR